MSSDGDLTSNSRSTQSLKEQKIITKKNILTNYVELNRLLRESTFERHPWSAGGPHETGCLGQEQ